jgi:pyruvate formate lyase activating enzyme
MPKEAMLYRQADDQKVHGYFCHHHCRISNSKSGICGMRQNRDGTLFTNAYGEDVAVNVDTIEKKPFYHVLPGSVSFSMAAMGRNFRCGFCQSWQISQASERKKMFRSNHELFQKILIPP